MTFQRILIAVDATELGPRVARVGFDLATTLGAVTALVHVIGPAMTTVDEQGAEVVEQAAIQLLAEIATRAATAPTDRFAPFGDRAEQIVKTARDWRADLLVVGTRDRSKLLRMFMGSVTDAVVGHAPCPMLVVPVE